MVLTEKSFLFFQFDKELLTLRNNRWKKAFSENDESTSDLKATIVIEHLIQASDVSHTMQHWHIFRRWNERLFEEMYRAYKDGRATRDIEAILERSKSGGTSLILSTHDMGQARRMADHVVFLLGGQVIETGPAAAFFERPQTPQAQAFLRGDIVE